MEWFKAIADLVGVLVWPGVLVFFLLRFRTSLHKLFERMTSAEVAGNRLEFGEELRDAEARTEEALEAAEEQDLPAINAAGRAGDAEKDSDLSPDVVELLRAIASDTGEGDSRRLEAAKLLSNRSTNYRRFLEVARETIGAGADPSGIVIPAWVRVETELRSLYEEVYPGKSAKVLPLGSMLKDLRSFLAPPAFEALDSMRQLRNQLAHGQGNVSAAEALAYRENAYKLADLIAAVRVGVKALRNDAPESDDAADS